MTMMHRLGRVLQPERDEQTYRDGEQVHKELTRTADRVFRCMDVEHVPLLGQGMWLA